jgi:NAD(P)-dependent dehydrogenase (short-subunit alcohol dehydrogenase family)
MNKSVAIVTGANRGLGREITIELARKGFTVVMACRNLQKSLPVRDEIRSLSGSDNVDILELDLADFNSIRTFVEIFRAKYSKLNVLVNNAGILTFHKTFTAQGLESTVGINFFGPYLLANLLIPMFPLGENNRIVNVSSVIYPYGTFSFDKINDHTGFKAYAISKYAIILGTLELAERLKDKGITVNAVHPGVVKTCIFSNRKFIKWLINSRLVFFMISAEAGAAPVVRLAVSDRVKGITGKYFRRFNEETISEKLADTGFRKAFIGKVESFIKNK